MPTYYYRVLPYHYYNNWMLGDFIIDDFGNSTSVWCSVYGIEYDGYED